VRNGSTHWHRLLSWLWTREENVYTRYYWLTSNCMELNLVIGTWVLAAATIALVGVTWWMARQQNDAMRQDLRARLQLQFIDRFDGSKMIGARKELAQLFLSKAPHHKLKETATDFFEDMSLPNRIP